MAMCPVETGAIKYLHENGVITQTTTQQLQGAFYADPNIGEHF
jgi:hypothetical protein